MKYIAFIGVAILIFSIFYMAYLLILAGHPIFAIFLCFAVVLLVLKIIMIKFLLFLWSGCWHKWKDFFQTQK